MTDPTNTTTRIAIGIITRRRPKGLARTLASLDAIEVPAGCEVEVIVVDNDDPGAAEAHPPPTVLGRSVHRVAEPEPGIPFARNRAIEEARLRADRLVFIDDDETVEPDWLVRLVGVMRETGAPVVTGPALPRFPDNAPVWAARSGIYDCHRYRTGEDRPWAFTHNVIVDVAVLEDPTLRFDEGMRFTGGSDTQLFRRIREAGHRIVWADEAVAWEWYPESRVTRRWAFARSYRIGVTDAHMELRRSGGIGGRVRLLWLASRYAVRGVLRGLLALAHPPTALARCGWDLARGLGLSGGAFGARYDEYRTIHGS